MKKTLIAIFLIASLGLQAQYWSSTVDTVKFRLSRGKIFQCITYPAGNGNDSIKINGVMFYPSSAGTETDPVWTGDSVRYVNKVQGDTVYEFKIPTDTYLTPGTDQVVTGQKVFTEAKCVIANATLDGGTALSSVAGAGGNLNITLPNASGMVALTSNLYRMTRYTAYSSGGNSVEVMADSAGVTAALVGSTFTFTIPAGIKLVSAKIRITGQSAIGVNMGTNDMANSSLANRWMPIVHAWREDTGQQLTGITTPMDLTYHDKFFVNGLIIYSYNNIMINF